MRTNQKSELQTAFQWKKRSKLFNQYNVLFTSIINIAFKQLKWRRKQLLIVLKSNTLKILIIYILSIKKRSKSMGEKVEEPISIKLVEPVEVKKIDNKKNDLGLIKS